LSHESSVTFSGVVEKIITSAEGPAMAQIAVKGAEHLYKEIRIPNILKDANGNEILLREGVEVAVTISQGSVRHTAD